MPDKTSANQAGVDDAGVDQSDDPQIAIAVQETKQNVEHKLKQNSDPFDEYYYTLPSTPRKVEPGDSIYFHNGEEYWGSCVLRRVEEGRVYFFPIMERPLLADDRVPPEQGFRYLYRREEDA